jgi:lysophospholipase L1-like esterase
MKKLSIIITIIAVLYLYLSHAYIYYKISRADLKSPYQQSYYLAGDNASMKNLVYAALGDSLTSGVGADKYEDSYPYLLAQKLIKGDAITLKNFSFPGARTGGLINNLLPPAIAANPDIITLLIGVNDVHGNISDAKFKKNYQYILERLAKETNAKIYAIAIPSIGSNALIPFPYKYYFNWKTVKFNNIIKGLANGYNIKYIDLNTATSELFKKNGGHYAADLFHPSAAGYALWAKIIYDDINQ